MKIKTNQYIFLRVIVAISILLGNYSCKKDDSSPPGANSNTAASLQIMPLKVGNEWVFKETEFEVTGQIEDEEEITWSVEKDTVISNEKIFYFNQGNCLLNKIDGLYSYGSNYTLIAKYPGIAGESFTTGSSDISTIISTNKEVVCPAGSFMCYQYSTKISSSRTEINYFSPGNGLIRAEVYYLDSIQKPYLWKLTELVKITLK